MKQEKGPPLVSRPFPLYVAVVATLESRYVVQYTTEQRPREVRESSPKESADIVDIQSYSCRRQRNNAQHTKHTLLPRSCSPSSAAEVKSESSTNSLVNNWGTTFHRFTLLKGTLYLCLSKVAINTSIIETLFTPTFTLHSIFRWAIKIKPICFSIHWGQLGHHFPWDFFNTCLVNVKKASRFMLYL